MKFFLSVTVVLFLALTLIKCSEDNDAPLRKAQDILPGVWTIKSITLPAWGQGVTYQGTTFYVDTTLFDVGTMDISSFYIDAFAAHDPSLPLVACEFTIEGETFPVSINHLFVAGNEIVSYFRTNTPVGVQPIETPGEEFFWSSRIFSFNYIIEFEGTDTVNLFQLNQPDKHMIQMIRQ